MKANEFSKPTLNFLRFIKVEYYKVFSEPRELLLNTEKAFIGVVDFRLGAFLDCETCFDVHYHPPWR